jgi:tetratricopeptide (TPR) repeat protein
MLAAKIDRKHAARFLRQVLAILRSLAFSSVLIWATELPAFAENCNSPPNTTPEGVIAICSKIISEGKLTGRSLADSYVDRGSVYFRKSNYDQAIADFDIATRIDPKYFRPFLNRGIAYNNKHNWDRAIEEYDQALRLEPKFAIIYLYRGRAYRAKGQLDRSMQDYNTGLQLDANNSVFFLERSYIYIDAKNFDAAIRELDQALRLRPDDVDAHVARGLSYLRKVDFDRAIQDLSRAVQLNPKSVAALIQRGNVYNEKKDWDHAIVDYTSAISLNPREPSAYSGRSFAYSGKGEIDLELSDLDQCIRLNTPNPIVYFNRAVTRKKKGDIDGALKDFNEAISRNPRYIPAYVGRGLTYEAKGDRDSARKDYATVAILPAPSQEGSEKKAYNTARARLTLLGGSSQPVPAIVQPPSRPAQSQNNVSERRMALIFGNSSYNIRSLTNPVRDARAVSSAFRQMGFEVTDGYDLDYTNMRRMISEFALRAAAAKISVVYYAGHGIQFQGHNYLVPIDAKLTSLRTANFELFDLDQIIATLDDPARTTIIILDACRNNPFGTQGASVRALDNTAGLAGYSGVSSGMLIAFATAPGRVAEDGAGEHSPFTGALLQHVTTPNMEVLDVFRRVRQAVIKETNGKQIPWEQNSLVGDVYLAGLKDKSTAK